MVSFSGTRKDSMSRNCKIFVKPCKIRIKRLKTMKVKNNKANIFNNTPIYGLNFVLQITQNLTPKDIISTKIFKSVKVIAAKLQSNHC